VSNPRYKTERQTNTVCVLGRQFGCRKALNSPARQDARTDDSTPLTDLIARAGNASLSDEERRIAIEQVRLRTLPAVTGYVAKVAHRRVRDSVVDEVVEETYRRAQKSPDTYDPALGPVLRWLTLVATGAWKDWLRHDRVRQRVDLRFQQGIADRTLSSARVSNGTWVMDAIYHAVEALPSQKQRDVFQLRMIEEKSYEEIARMMKLSSADAAKELKCRMLQNLCKTLDGKKQVLFERASDSRGMAGTRPLRRRALRS